MYQDLSTRRDWPFRKRHWLTNSLELEPEASGKRAFKKDNGGRNKVKCTAAFEAIKTFQNPDQNNETPSQKKCREAIKSLSEKKTCLLVFINVPTDFGKS